MTYQVKASDKIGKGVYQGNMLLFERTTSFIVACPKEPSQSIAEEITEELELEENLPIERQHYDEME